MTVPVLPNESPEFQRIAPLPCLAHGQPYCGWNQATRWSNPPINQSINQNVDLYSAS